MKNIITRLLIFCIGFASLGLAFAAPPLNYGTGWNSEPAGRIKAYYNRTAEFKVLKALLTSSDYTSAFNPKKRANQGGLGSCTAYGALHEYALAYYMITGKVLDLSTLSTLGFYWDCRDRDGTTNRDAGSYISTAAWVFENIGMGSSSVFPYVEKNFKLKPPADYYTSAEKTIVVAAYAIDASTAASRHKGILTALSNKRGVVMGGYVDNGVFRVGKDGFEPPYVGPRQGGHCRTIIGHNDKMTHKYGIFGKTYTGFYTVINSWGSDWGMNGISYIPYATIDDPKVYDDFFVYVTVKKLAFTMPRTQAALSDVLIVSL